MKCKPHFIVIPTKLEAEERTLWNQEAGYLLPDSVCKGISR